MPWFNSFSHRNIIYIERECSYDFHIRLCFRIMNTEYVYYIFILAFNYKLATPSQLRIEQNMINYSLKKLS